MADLKPFEQIDAGGVDSRSNPINMPRNRALRCLNWVPKQAGFWELRWGYSSVTMSTVSASSIHSMFPYRNWAGNKYVLFMSNDLSLKTLDTATGTVTSPTVRGTAIASSAKGAGFFGSNHFYYGNGTDQKWFDGSTWRDSGLRAIAISEVDTVAVVEGVREFTAAQASSVTLTVAAGGSFPGDTLTGRLIYAAIFDKSTNEIGPATISVGPGRIVIPASDKLTVGGLPNLSSVNANWVKLIGGSVDGGNYSTFFTNTSTGISNASGSGTTLTITTSSPHGLSTGDVVIVATHAAQFNPGGIFSVTVTGGSTFTAVLPFPASFSVLNPGTVFRIVQAGNAVTSVDVTADTRNFFYQVNQNIGLPASTIGNDIAGYQFYACLYNATAGQHVGNRVAFGSRALQTAYRSNWRISGLPDYSGVDSEWVILIGRTGDGAEVPYPCTDNSANWLSTISGQTAITVTDASIDGQHELPVDNGIVPSQCNMFCLAGDYAYSADTGSPYIRRSGSLLDSRAGTFTGDPMQSWSPADFDTFPTAEAVTGMFEVDQEVFVGTLHDCAISTNLAGIQQWSGPWAVGIAGRRAGIKCGAWGFCWVSGDKQLCTLSQGVPVVISDEYELAELSQIGDAHLSTVEVSYYRSAEQNKDEMRIEGQKSDGTPYTIIHDFKLREPYSAPGSIYGQGYSSQYTGELSSAFTVSQVRDGSGKLQIYAGGQNGQIYQLYSGADDAGTQYGADLILLINAGTQRPSVPFVDWYGDGAIDVSVGNTLSTSLASGAEFSFEQITPSDNPAQSVQGSENDFLYRAYFTSPEMQHTYLRFALNSHSADGNLSLNSPPHVPLESYGRLYELIPAVGDERAR